MSSNSAAANGPVVVAPDKFKGSLGAPEVAEALAAGIAMADPRRVVRRCPVADGGEGTVSAALSAGWSPVTATVAGPTGEPVDAVYARRGPVALLELAAAAGLALLPDGPAPMDAGTEGLGSLIVDAIERGARDVVVGLGGSASTDGGAGLLRGLGARVLDLDGRDVPPGGRALLRAHRIDLSGVHSAVRSTRFSLASDVNNPLLGPLGAAAVYGPQKGATADQVAELDVALEQWSRVLGAAAGCSSGAVADRAGAGAAGGAGCGLTALFGARHDAGVSTVLELVDFDAMLDGAALVVTGEGRLDRQTLHGKAPAGVASAAAARGVPTVAVAGRCDLSAAELSDAGFTRCHALVEMVERPEIAVADATRLLRLVGACLVDDGGRGSGSRPRS